MSMFYPQTDDENLAIATWLQSVLPPHSNMSKNVRCIAVVRDGEIIGAIGYDNWRGKDIEIYLGATSPRWATTETIGLMLSYPFIQLSTNRATAIIHPKNKRIRKFVEGVGFKLEGTLRDCFYPHNALIYGMTRTDYLNSRFYERVKDMVEPINEAKKDHVPLLGEIRASSELVH